MNIIVGECSDALEIIIDGKRFYINQEDSAEKLVDAFKEANPKANVTYEEFY